MTTTEKNKLIADFMGFETNNVEVIMPEKFSQLKPFKHSKGFFKTSIFKHLELQFHSSWDWLMSVVEKIESLKFSVLIGKNNCVIEQTFGKTSLNLGVSKGQNKIEAVYNACVTFIEWYNENPA